MPERMESVDQSTGIRVMAVIVLYKMTPANSASLRSLLAAAAFVPTGTLQLKLLLYDNTPSASDPGPLPANVLYAAQPCNAGLAEAYNKALEVAQAQGFDWLLTLDQDSELPPEFLVRICDIAEKVKDTPAVAAIVPQITGDGRVFSPYWFAGGAVPRWYRRGYCGLPLQPTFAFNSGSVLRVSALRQIGGYNPWFWLDNSDAYVFRQLNSYGKSVFVAGDIEVVHSFSMMDIKGRITPGRYRNILLAETAFWDMEMGALAGLERTIRLAARTWKHWRHRDIPEIRALTFEFLRRRLLWSRGRRLRAWEAETRTMCPHLANRRSFFKPKDSSTRSQLKVSICMAAYNGERYIEKQLRSILDQLDDQDEIVIVDDASKDQTRNVVRSLNDNRIRVIEHARNCGVVATFEDAVRNATGDILFLADDDDIWAPNKLEKVLKAFQNHPDAQIVTTRVSMIDEHGRPSRDMLYSNRKRFHSGFWQNILRNHFQGSAMAFRSSLLPSVLPFPNHMGFFHDHWIGTRNAILNGSAVYIDEPLLYYRRHSQNASRKMSRLRQAKVRLQLLWLHLLRHVGRQREFASRSRSS